MSDTVKMVLMVLVLVGVFILTLWFSFWRMRRACDFILRDLRTKNAFDPASAVELPYAQTSLFRVGMRDYRPRALTALVQHGKIRLVDGGRYCLAEDHPKDGPA